MLASLSRMMFGTAWFDGGAVAATLLPEPSEAKRLGGGLPGGVVDAFVGLGAFNLSLKELTMEVGNVWPFSQISTSFFIFSFWSSGVVAMMSFIKMGISSVTLFTPAANVPSGAEMLGVCP